MVIRSPRILNIFVPLLFSVKRKKKKKLSTKENKKLPFYTLCLYQRKREASLCQYSCITLAVLDFNHNHLDTPSLYMKKRSMHLQLFLWLDWGHLLLSEHWCYLIRGKGRDPYFYFLSLSEQSISRSERSSCFPSRSLSLFTTK